MIEIHPVNLMPYFWTETTSKILENHLPYADIPLVRRALFHKPHQPNSNAIMRSQLAKIYPTLRPLLHLIPHYWHASKWIPQRAEIFTLMKTMKITSELKITE